MIRSDMIGASPKRTPGNEPSRLLRLVQPNAGPKIAIAACNEYLRESQHRGGINMEKIQDQQEYIRDVRALVWEHPELEDVYGT